MMYDTDDDLNLQTKSYGVTIQMKPLQYSHMLLSGFHYLTKLNWEISSNFDLDHLWKGKYSQLYRP